MGVARARPRRGAIDACRGWLDMATRFTGVVQGSRPGGAPDPAWIPIAGFQKDVRRLFAPRRRMVNPLAASLGKAAASRPSGARRPRSRPA